MELPEALDEQEKDNLESQLQGQTDFPVSVEDGISLTPSGSTDAVFSTGQSTVDSGDLDQAQNAIINAGFDFEEWRIGNAR
jgi:hypothetical protein